MYIISTFYMQLPRKRICATVAYN